MRKLLLGSLLGLTLALPLSHLVLARTVQPPRVLPRPPGGVTTLEVQPVTLQPLQPVPLQPIQSPVSSTQGATTFGFTAESGGGMRVRDWFDEKIGVDGAQIVQLVDTVKEVLPANDLGYLWSAAVA